MNRIVFQPREIYSGFVIRGCLDSLFSNDAHAQKYISCASPVSLFTTQNLCSKIGIRKASELNYKQSALVALMTSLIPQDLVDRGRYFSESIAFGELFGLGAYMLGELLAETAYRVITNPSLLPKRKVLQLSVSLLSMYKLGLIESKLENVLSINWVANAQIGVTLAELFSKEAFFFE